MPTLERIIYESRATGRTSSLLNVATILAESQRNNDRHGLTGALAAHEDRYIQVIEGDPERLDHLMRRIEGDARHSDIQVISRTPIGQRSFAGWSMAQAVIRPDLASALNAVMSRSKPDELLAILHAALPGEPSRVN